jgi:hypothetical protein
MGALLPFLTLDETCGQVDTWIRERLTQAGLRVVQTFDLHIARLAHADCTCPNHGMEPCSCQLVILLVYGKQEDPATLVIHGQDDKTWVSLATPMETQSRQSLEASVRHMLILHPHPPASLDVASPVA